MVDKVDIKQPKLLVGGVGTDKIHNQLLNSCPKVNQLVLRLLSGWRVFGEICSSLKTSRKLLSSAPRSSVGKMFSRMGVSCSGRRGRKLGVVYELPVADVLRERFAKQIGMEANDIF